MTEKWDTLTKKELIQLLEPYDDEKHIVFKVNLKQGNVGFWDVKKDEINSDTDKLVLMSKALDKWYAEDIQELVKKNNELKKESYGNLDGLETYKALYSHLSEKFSNLEADYDDLKKENEQLKKALKNKYDFEICENCKFGQYDVDYYGEGEFECLKGHDAGECDGKTECENFELDLERFLE